MVLHFWNGIQEDCEVLVFAILFEDFGPEVAAIIRDTEFFPTTWQFIEGNVREFNQFCIAVDIFSTQNISTPLNSELCLRWCQTLGGKLVKSAEDLTLIPGKGDEIKQIKDH
ncbi:hypothetical protein KPH14_001010 [Odynerus spinipes]|uniref:Uncharacterized protein n=1 Tax=Odynerus spinipes TaxID=1348599 RepID=A0AAD9RFB7_9HYME|nr:hypothetical protein KPH14_001010 [Odynerus spinipes]